MAKIQKMKNIQLAITGKPYNHRAPNSYWYYAATRSTCISSFVQFLEGYVQTFVELIWNYAIDSVSSSSLCIIGFGIRDLSENERMGLSLIMNSTKWQLQ